MTDESKKILRNISLVEVMRANGYEPVRLPGKADGQAVYLCPFHDDKTPSFYVDLKAKASADAPGWGCFGCGKRGYGAIALQAALMGYDHTALNGKQMGEVCQRLVDDHNLELDDWKKSDPTQRTEAIDPQPCDCSDLAPWTVQHLTALGFAVKNATEPDGEGNYRVRYKAVDNNADEHKADTNDADEHKADCQQPEPLFRCSIDREYWRGRGEAKTAQEWGETLEREFKIFPVATFITDPVDVTNGSGKVSLKIPSRRTYPIFAMTYDWGIKKYEPKGGKNKWTWNNVSDTLSTKVYGDSVAVDAIAQATHPDKAQDKKWFADYKKDKRHPIVVIEKDSDGNPVKAKMKRLVLCSGPRDAMQMWAATDAHVLWLHNELAGIKDGVVDEWLRALLVRMSEVAIDIYVCYDLDATGMACSQSIALENANVHWVRLPREMTQIKLPTGKKGVEKSLKDVTDFVTHFHPIQKLFTPDLRKSDPSESLMRLLKNSLTMKFWIDKPTTKKDKAGERETNVRYVLSVANLLQFLEAKGIHCTDEQGQRLFYQLNFHNTFRYLDTSRMSNELESVCRTAMLNWIDAHINDEDAPYKANLVNTIFTGKGLDARTMSTMQPEPINAHSYGETFDHFFFENTAVYVDKDTIKTVGYSQLRYLTNEECIMPGDFHVIKQPWRIILNPEFENEKKAHEEKLKKYTTMDDRAAENIRWRDWQQLWKYKLITDKPFEEMPMHFQLFYNFCRIFWEKEALGQELTPVEKQMQDMHFIQHAHAIGYAITRHHSSARQQTVQFTDYAVSDERKASGRNGKTIITDAIATLRPWSANVAGKPINGSNITLEILLGNVKPGVHTVVCIDELPKGFKVEQLFNAQLVIVIKRLYQQPVTLRGDDVPKLVITSNQPLDLSSGSAKGRIYLCFISNYYHAGTDDGRYEDHAPKDDFYEKYHVQEMARNLPPDLLNELQNLMIGFAQFFLQYPTETINPPREARSVSRDLYAMTGDRELVKWLQEYFQDEAHFKQPIAQNEMAISLLEKEGKVINNESVGKAWTRIKKGLKPCVNRMGIVMNPDVVLDQQSYKKAGKRKMKAWVTVCDSNGCPLKKDGKKLPRKLSDASIDVYYFYRNLPGEIPTHSYDPKHKYDNGYVWAAMETDPEAEEE